MQDGRVGLILLPAKEFTYDKAVGYSFDTAVVVEEGSDNLLLFIRIESWNPQYRAEAVAGQIDFCIPIAYEGASDCERLLWTIPLGGSWSDCKREALMVFDSAWRDWFRPLSDGLAFSNPGAESAAFMNWRQHDFAAIRAFCA
jgi:hypothetical protein